MPTELTWHLALVLVGDGFCLGVGFLLASAIYAAVVWVLGQRRVQA